VNGSPESAVIGAYMAGPLELYKIRVPGLPQRLSQLHRLAHFSHRRFFVVHEESDPKLFVLVFVHGWKRNADFVTPTWPLQRTGDHPHITGKRRSD
jgi:hypothetical protein